MPLHSHVDQPAMDRLGEDMPRDRLNEDAAGEKALSIEEQIEGLGAKLQEHQDKEVHAQLRRIGDRLDDVGNVIDRFSSLDDLVRATEWVAAKLSKIVEPLTEMVVGDQLTDETRVWKTEELNDGEGYEPTRRLVGTRMRVWAMPNGRWAYEGHGIHGTNDTESGAKADAERVAGRVVDCVRATEKLKDALAETVQPVGDLLTGETDSREELVWAGAFALEMQDVYRQQHPPGENKFANAWDIADRVVDDYNYERARREPDKPLLTGDVLRSPDTATAVKADAGRKEGQ